MAKEITYKDIQQVNSEIKTVDIKGKDYAEVPQRVQAFRKLYPNGAIVSEMIYLENGMCVFKATACDENGQILSSGHAYEKEGNGFINKTSFIENCETSAVGRCVGFLGIGSDTSMASAEEVLNAKKQQAQMNAEELKAELKQLLADKKADTAQFLEWASKRYERKLESVDVMDEAELKDAIKNIKAQKKGDK